MGKLVDYCMMKIYSLIKVKETNQTWSEEDDFVMEKPKITLTVRQLNFNNIAQQHTFTIWNRLMESCNRGD